VRATNLEPTGAEAATPSAPATAMADTLLRNYLDDLLTRYHYLDFRGIRQEERIVELELDDVFVPLKLVSLGRRDVKDLPPDLAEALELLPELEQGDGVPSPEELARLLRERRAAGGRRARRGPHDQTEDAPGRSENNAAARLHRWLERERALGRRGEPAPIEQVLGSHRQLVLLGDSGSGKTTLVKWLARTCALGKKAVAERLGLDESLTPIVLPIAEYAKACCNADGQGLSPVEYLEQEHERRAGGLGKLLRQRIDEGEAFLLFDGLDEVPNTEVRLRAARNVEATLRACAEQGATGTRCLVTSRVYGYELCRLRGPEHFELAPFEEPQIRRFIEGWAWALERSLRPKAPRRAEAEKEAEELRRAIFDGAVHRETLQSFARNPLLLTILALVQRQWGGLPDLRAQLYEVALKTLVGTWNRARGLAGPIEGIELPDERTMQLWEPVALWMHREYPGGTAPREEIVDRLANKLTAEGTERAAALATAESYLDAAARWAGLLLERGPNAFGFLHQTFQEYLAARALVRVAPDPYEALKGFFFAPRWREVVLLAAGYLGAVQGRTEDATRLVDRIRGTSDVLEPLLGRHLALAGTILSDRVPVPPRCVEETALALVTSQAGADGVLLVLDALAGMASLSLGGRVVDETTERFGAYILSWEFRCALLLVASEDPKSARALIDLGLRYQGDDVHSLAAALAVHSGDLSQEVLQGLRLPSPFLRASIGRCAERTERAIRDALARADVQDVLVHQLADESEMVRLHAEATLAGAGALGEEAQQALVGLLRDDSAELRWTAAALLRRARVHEEETERTLVELLTGDNDQMRHQAARILSLPGHLGEETLPVAEEMLSDESPEMRYQAARILSRAGALGEEAQCMLVHLLSEESPALHADAARMLSRAAPLADRAQRALVGLLSHESREARYRAAQVLLHFGKHVTEAQNALMDLLSEESVGVMSRCYVAIALARAGILVDAAERTLHGLLTHDAPDVRSQAVEAVSQTGVPGDNARGALIGLLPDGSAKVRALAAEALSRVDALGSDAESALRSLLSDESPGVRRQAVAALFGAGKPVDGAQGVLVELLSDDSAEVRAEAAEASARVSVWRPETQRALAALLSAESSSVRSLAASTLSHVGALEAETQPALVGLLSDKDPMVRYRAAETLARHAEQQVAEGGPPPAWLDTREPPRRVEGEPPRRQPRPPRTKKPDTLAAALDEALRAKGKARERAVRAVEARLRPATGQEVREVLAWLGQPSVAAAMPSGGEEHGELRRALVEALTQRLRELASRRQEGDRSAAEEEQSLVDALPALLFAEVIDAALDDLGAEAVARCRTRLVALPFNANDAEAARLLGLYAALAEGASAKERTVLLRRVRQACEADAPTVRSAALEGLAGFLSWLKGTDRNRAFDLILTSATAGDSDDVRRAAARALHLVRSSLTADERQAVTKAKLPALAELV